MELEQKDVWITELAHKHLVKKLMRETILGYCELPQVCPQTLFGVECDKLNICMTIEERYTPRQLH